MDDILRREPGQPYATFVKALMLAFAGDPRVLPMYQEAQIGFRRLGDHEAEFWAVMAMLERAAWMSDADLGATAYQRGLELARATDDRDAVAYAQETGAQLALGLADYGRAETLLREAQASASPQTLWWIRWRIVEGLGRTASATGRPRLALESYDQAAALARTDRTFLAFTMHGRAEEAVRLASANEIPAEEAEQRLDEALAVSRAAGMKVYLDRGELPTTMLRAALRGPTPGSIRDVEAALAYGQPYPRGASWLVVATHPPPSVRGSRSRLEHPRADGLHTPGARAPPRWFGRVRWRAAGWRAARSGALPARGGRPHAGGGAGRSDARDSAGSPPASRRGAGRRAVRGLHGSLRLALAPVEEGQAADARAGAGAGRSARGCTPGEGPRCDPLARGAAAAVAAARASGGRGPGAGSAADC